MPYQSIFSGQTPGSNPKLDSVLGGKVNPYAGDFVPGKYGQVNAQLQAQANAANPLKNNFSINGAKYNNVDHFTAQFDKMNPDQRYQLYQQLGQAATKDNLAKGIYDHLNANGRAQTRNGWQKAGDILKGVGDFAYNSGKDMIVQAGNTVGNAYSTANSVIKQSDYTNALAANRQQNQQLDGLVAAGKISSQQAALHKAANFQKLQQLAKAANSAQGNLNLINPRQAAGDAAQTTINIGTLGVGGALLKGGEVAGDAAVQGGEQLLKQGGKAAAKRIVGGATEGALLNTGSSVIDTARNPNAKLVDYAKNAAPAAALGAVMGGTFAGAGEGVRYLKGRGSSATVIPETPAPTAGAAETAKTPTKSFAPLDTTTQTKVSDIKAHAEAIPVPEGKTRLFQTNDGTSGKSDQYFKNPDHLANYINGRADNAKLSFRDVPTEDVASVPGKPTVFRVAGESNATRSATSEPIAPPDTGKAPSVEDKYIAEQVASHKSPDEFLNKTVDHIWQDNKKGAGTEIIHNHLDEKGVGSDAFAGTRISNNNPFYQKFYAEYGHAPTKSAIKDMVQQEMDGHPTLLTENEVSPVDAEVYRQLQDRQKEPLPTPPSASEPSVASSPPSSGGERRVSGGATKAEQRAITNELADHFDNKATYAGRSYADETAKAVKLVNDNPERAMEIATGRTAGDNPVHEVAIAKAVEQKAIKEGDAATLQTLAMSDRHTKTSEAAQRLGAEGYHVEAGSPVDAMRRVVKDRTDAVEKRLKDPVTDAVKKETAAIKAKVKAPSRTDWQLFIDSIKC